MDVIFANEQKIIIPEEAIPEAGVMGALGTGGGAAARGVEFYYGLEVSCIDCGCKAHGIFRGSGSAVPSGTPSFLPSA